MSEYDPLAAHLARFDGETARMTLAQIEGVLGRPLPESARRHRPFWANQSDTRARPWARAWQSAGWRVARGGIETTDGAITAVRFERVGRTHNDGCRARPTAAVWGDEARPESLARRPLQASAGAAPALLIISACSRGKLIRRPDELQLPDFADSARLAERERELGESLRPAAEMYVGAEHRLVISAVSTLSTALGTGVRHRIVSAGYGLIEPERRIAPYDVTFNEMRPGEVVRWARRIGIPAAFEAEIAQADLTIVLLGTRYIWAIEPRRLDLKDGQRVIFVAGPSQWSRIGPQAGITIVPAGSEDAGRRGTNNYEQKGWLIDRFARGVASAGPSAVATLLDDSSPRGFLELCDTA